MPDRALRPVADAFAVAVAAAARFRGATAPNPPVGCVLMDGDGRQLAVGAHARAGQAHAEAAALAACAASGASGRIDAVVVTLEPCNHWGRTPPCTEAILGTPARTVWIGTRDPDPRVAGGGADRLRAAGLDVRLLEDEAPEALRASAELCRVLIAPFRKQRREGRPWITVKQALDVQGSMIPPAGRKTFTSPESLALAHRLRRRADAILTGSGTVLADDPAFTVRLVPDHPGKRRPLVILDRRARVPGSYLAAAESRGLDAEIASDLDQAFAGLGARGCLEVLVEAGPSLTSRCLDSGTWDEHVIIRRTSDDGPDTVEVIDRREGSRGIRPVVGGAGV